MRTPLRSALIASLVLALVAVPALSWSAPVRVKATAADEWNPSYQHVAPGTRVVWVNPERLGEPHDMSAYGKNWSKSVLLEPGERTAKRFRKTGTFKYRCRLHSTKRRGEQCQGMCGVIHVAK